MKGAPAAHAAGVWLLLLQAGCGLSERDDFLVGRSCVPVEPTGCDEQQVCLPHSYAASGPMDFRCRDAASFALRDGREAPLAFCDQEEGLLCPEGIPCGAGRIRDDAGLRRTVCKRPDDTFGPPADLGS